MLIRRMIDFSQGKTAMEGGILAMLIMKTSKGEGTYREMRSLEDDGDLFVTL